MKAGYLFRVWATTLLVAPLIYIPVFGERLTISGTLVGIYFFILYVSTAFSFPTFAISFVYCDVVANRSPNVVQAKCRIALISLLLLWANLFLISRFSTTPMLSREGGVFYLSHVIVALAAVFGFQLRRRKEAPQKNVSAGRANEVLVKVNLIALSKIRSGYAVRVWLVTVWIPAVVLAFSRASTIPFYVETDGRGSEQSFDDPNIFTVFLAVGLFGSLISLPALWLNKGLCKLLAADETVSVYKAKRLIAFAAPVFIWVGFCGSVDLLGWYLEWPENYFPYTFREVAVFLITYFTIAVGATLFFDLRVRKGLPASEEELQP